jgi:hypothetical protein
MTNNLNKIQMAETAWQAGHRDEAIQILEDVNELKQDNAIISVLVHFYVEQKRFKDVLMLISDQPTTFLNEIPIFIDYFEALVQTNHFILARKEVLNQKTLDLAEQTKLLAKLTERENQYAEEFPQTVMEAEKRFYHIGDQKIIEQPQIIEQAYQLPQVNFIRAAKFNLLDPYLNQLTRVSILKDLGLIGMIETVQFLWVDGKQYEVNLKRVGVRDAFWDALEKLLQNDSDPIQGAMVAQQATLFYELAYPFATKLFQTPVEWHRALQEQFLQQKVVPQFEKLNQIINSIITD